MKLFGGMKLAIVAAAFVGLSTAGCNTFKGAGRDIQAGGRGIENAAEGAHHHDDDRHDHDARHRHTIKASSERNGTISPSGVTSVRYGAAVTYKITPYRGHHLTDVLVDGRSVGAVTRYRFTDVRADHTIDALFDENSHR